MSISRLFALAGLGTLLLSATAACSAQAGDTSESSEAPITATGLPGLPPLPRCGGIAGLTCPSGYDCKLEGWYPDAMGTCEPAPIWDVCNVDSDCVAVRAHGCCAFWDKEAVHKDHVEEYNASWDEMFCAAVACAPKHPDLFAPAEAPLCVSNRCAMVRVDAIACGGHSPNPHHCPSGYSCEGAGLPVDAPGSCTSH